MGLLPLKLILEKSSSGVILLCTIMSGSIRGGLNRRPLYGHGSRYNKGIVNAFNLHSYPKVDTVVDTGRLLSRKQWF
ncbi:hypothetical protein J1N35_004609 [Gossypium stocksii]|uniref:Uncharacterized protein n=1 Tax=Gossypium stocksii TaxID=47602 RepID=A0A9D3WC90_9ROSI|nr:hypothetical protein J1N35_004609 [Gossypium stocksii]